MSSRGRAHPYKNNPKAGRNYSPQEQLPYLYGKIVQGAGARPVWRDKWATLKPKLGDALRPAEKWMRQEIEEKLHGLPELKEVEAKDYVEVPAEHVDIHYIWRGGNDAAVMMKYVVSKMKTHPAKYQSIWHRAHAYLQANPAEVTPAVQLLINAATAISPPPVAPPQPEAPDVDTCVICMEKERDQVAFPCKHRVYCDECVLQVHAHQVQVRCPMCRTVVQRFEKIYN